MGGEDPIQNPLNPYLNQNQNEFSQEQNNQFNNLGQNNQQSSDFSMDSNNQFPQQQQLINNQNNMQRQLQFQQIPESTQQFAQPPPPYQANQYIPPQINNNLNPNQQNMNNPYNNQIPHQNQNQQIDSQNQNYNFQQKQNAFQSPSSNNDQNNQYNQQNHQNQQQQQQQQYQPNQQIIVVEQQQQNQPKFVNLQYFRTPAQFSCICGYHGMSVTNQKMGKGILIWVIILFVFTFCCALIPLCCNSCYDIKHNCPRCGRDVGTNAYEPC
ncbi:hypothetical protein PPERSA_00286 [Pseudocohnilembus persalinus]|uniref:LITAF domain-containing protein n=1 Tax=Pseudocohnilembus persalinus TaxID=266149 RepID=A0A0V0Q960_PSEPJ|nr:hypothetical protein PPERSA_00286 [Pseudocohnilembus persalinus]|eukprot:KRW98698.1 hypothetical protein PPERSA_00286 [Pseudocohnilembus persalinus]